MQGSIGNAGLQDMVSSGVISRHASTSTSTSTASSGEGPGAAAQHGFSGGASELPYRAEMENYFGEDFGDVQAYTGSVAQEASSSLGANAYAVGNQVAFSDPNPSRELVAHELTHVVQHRGSGGGGPQFDMVIDAPNSAAEREASAVESAVHRGEALPEISAQAPAIQRQPNADDTATEETANGDAANSSAIDEASLGKLRSIRGTIKDYLNYVFDQMWKGAQQFSNITEIPPMPETTGQALWKYASDEFIKFGLGKLGAAGTIATHVKGSLDAVSKAKKALASWNDTLALKLYVARIQDQANALKKSALQLTSGDSTALHKSLVDGWKAKPEGERAGWLTTIETEAGKLTTYAPEGKHFETSMYVAWVRSKADGTSTYDRSNQQSIYNGTLNVTYKGLKDGDKRSLSLQHAWLAAPGATGILERLKSTMPIHRVTDAPFQKSVTIRVDKSTLFGLSSQRVSNGWSMYGPDNSFIKSGMGGPLHEGSISREFLGGNGIEVLPLTWSQVKAK